MLDHLVLATPDLAATVADFAGRTGVVPAPGGSHPGLGTANALVGLGPDSYLEIVGPDLGQPPPAGPRPFGVDELAAAALVGWAVHPPDLDAAVERARHEGHETGPVASMSRRTPDGQELNWRLTPLRTGVVPFLIDWGDTPHPSTRGLPAVGLIRLTLQHPDPPSVERVLAALGTPTTVRRGAEALTAVLSTPRGPVTLSAW